MNKKALHTLEYDKIIQRLTAHCTSDAAKQQAEVLLPKTSREMIETAQKETAAAFARIIRNGSFSFAGNTDVSLYSKQLSIGASLHAGELLKIAGVLEVAKRAKAYGTKQREDDADDILTERFAALVPLTPLCEEIRRCILSEDEIADDASSKLASIRRSIAVTNGRIRDKLSQMISSASVRDYLQDAVVTMRDGRYCLPVRAEYKSQVSGMVHDSSGSGATLFIEPMAVVQYNNEIRELERSEAEEIERILAELSEKVAEQSEAIEMDHHVLAALDFIFAKGKLALDMNAVAPRFNDNGVIVLRGARHPLLDAKTVVPIDITLGEEFEQLIITGPNTGGKTVSLKTVGLLALMGQAGLHIPAKDRSALPVFTEVYADIGDEQSIEQSLSTFSSHLKNIVGIMDHAKENPKQTLVLFDELCAGTDPAEGAALATSILNLLREWRVRTMATTHYSELKLYALSTEGVENASCEFNVETLSPTYRLLVGIPGKSNAFAISKKLGLPEAIIEDAKSRMDENDRSFETLLVDLENKRHALEEEEESIRRDKEEIAVLREKVKEQNKNIDRKREEIIRSANEKASNILRDAKNTADAAIRNINKYGTASPDMARLEKTRGNLGQKLSQTQQKSGQTKAAAPAAKAVDPKKLHIGDAVRVLSMDTTGTVHKLPNARGELEVTMGIMHTKVNLREIELIDEKETYTAMKGKTPVKSRSGGGGGFSKAATISPELMLLGMTADEAVAALDKYLDDAYLSHLHSLRIVHGKGTGVLRKAVHDYLRRQSQVVDFHLAEFGEGDSGVTIVEI